MSEPTMGRRPTGNLFLDHLSDRAFTALQPSMAKIQLKSSELISDNFSSIERVIFPINAVISVVVQMATGDTAEVGIIGREGMTGLAVAFGHLNINQRSIVQIPNSGLSVGVEDFRNAMEQEPELKSFTMRYAQAVLIASGRLIACNALHPTIERCARWLLTAQDRIRGDLLLLTQEFLSQMLGVRRASVAIAASELQAAGFISYSRGHITINNRAGLESVACECYEAMENEWTDMMGYGIRSAIGASKPPSHHSPTAGGYADGSALTEEGA